MKVRTGWTVTAILLGAVVFGIAGTFPPRDAPPSAPVEVFSAQRAMQHVERIAAVPHPTGSAAHDAVRDYLIDQLQSLGMIVEIQHGGGAADSGRPPTPLQNIIARRPGADSTRRSC